MDRFVDVLYVLIYSAAAARYLDLYIDEKKKPGNSGLLPFLYLAVVLFMSWAALSIVLSRIFN